MANPQYTDEMRVTLFPNDKRGNEKRPDFRGTLQIDGVKYKLSVWNRTSKKGGAFLSGQVELDKTDGTQSHMSAPQTGYQTTTVYNGPRQAELTNNDAGGKTDEDVPF